MTERTIESYQAAHDLREIGKKLEAAALPPTAEQTSIARFNALADQIREDREAISSWISLCRRELSAKLDIIINSKKECPDAEMCGCVTHCEHDHPKPRAVAKKKAAPLVGKKGTGRKG